MGKYSKKHRAYTDKYVAEKYDTTLIRLPKGKKEKVREFAAQQGKSMNAFIIELIDREMNAE